jgi:uncharacterized membrane protein
LFLVRYSIEAGLLGPGVRVLLGGVFALGLLLAGEFARRKESLSAIAPLSIANIPAILTTAGTAVAFGTVYSAYALYGFLAPASAFILLGCIALGTLAAALLHGPALAGLGIAAAFVTPVLVSSGKADYWALYRSGYCSRLRAGATEAVAMACHDHHRLRLSVDAVRHRRPRRICATCLQRHRRLRPRSSDRGSRLPVRTNRRARPY